LTEVVRCCSGCFPVATSIIRGRSCCWSLVAPGRFS